MQEGDVAVRLISAVLANVTVGPNETININLTVAREMVNKILIEEEIVKIQRRQ